MENSIFFFFETFPYRWFADCPVPLHGDAHCHEDGAWQADAGERVEKPATDFISTPMIIHQDGKIEIRWVTLMQH